MRDDELTARQFEDSAGVEDWRVLTSGAEAWFAAPSHVAGAALVHRIAGLAPDIDLRATGVHARFDRLTTADVTTAREISAAAREFALPAEPAALQSVQLAFDSMDPTSIMPFWRTVLAYEQAGEDDLVDPVRRDPGIWFQQQDRPRPLRNRIHLDVARPDALTPAGASALSGHPTHVLDVALADADGNEVDSIPFGPIEPWGPGTEDWRGPFVAMTFYRTSGAAQSAELASAAAELADAAGLPLLIDLRPDGVTIDTGKDEWEVRGYEDLARRIQAAARGMGLTADPSRGRFVQIGFDAADIPAVRRFWQAALGYVEHACGDLYDPRRLNLPIFFQPIDTTEKDRRRQRNRIHVDAFVPHDQAQSRIDAALAAGGRIVYDAEAPEWCTIADPEGNEVDIAVSYGRAEREEAKRAAAG